MYEGGDPPPRPLTIRRGEVLKASEAQDGAGRDEDTYGPTNLEERKARIEALTAPTNYPGDKLEAPEGYITPATAVEWKLGDAGPYAVDAEGKTLPLIRQPGVLPLYRDPTIDSIRPAMPGMLDVVGNAMGAPGGVAASRVIRAGLTGERPVANIVAAGGAGEKSAARAIERELSPMGLYSHGAESASSLPQAKGTPEQMAAMLQKAGVKPAEMEGFGESFAGRPSVTREEAAQFFKERMPQVEETVLGGKSKVDFTPEMERRLDELTEKRISTGLTEEEMAEKNQLFRLQEEAASGRSRTKFGQYTLPGGENYREVLLKLPQKQQGRLDEVAKINYETFERRGGDPAWEELTPAQQQKYLDWAKNNSYADLEPAKFKSSHWDDPNVLVHMRMSDRTGPNGEKILHVEEIQSDWGQQGKKEGFKIPLTPELENSANSIIENKLQPGAEFMNPSWRTPDGKIDRRAIGPSYVEFLEKNGTISSEEAKTLQNWNKARGFDASGVSSAPYVTSTQGWTDLALKRALKEAAEGGYDKLVWTPGVEQAKRYDLSHHIDEIHYAPGRNGTASVEAYKGNNNVFNKHNATQKEIADTFGKEIADKIAAGHGDVNRDTGYNVLSNLDLQTGGEGMKGYYDKIVPAQLQKLLKKLDPEAKVGMTDVMLPPKGGIGHNNPPLEAPGITITPTMRENILKGMPHMAEGGAVEPPASDPVEPEDEQVNYAQGGEVAPANLVSKIHHEATEQGLSVRDLSLLIKLATGAPAQWSHGLAGHLMSGDDTFLRGHSAKYPKIAEIIEKLDAMLSGDKVPESANVDQKMIAEAARVNRNPNVKKALGALMQRT